MGSEKERSVVEVERGTKLVAFRIGPWAMGILVAMTCFAATSALMGAWRIMAAVLVFEVLFLTMAISFP